MTKREPLDATYKFLIASGVARPPFIPKDRLYKRLPAELRHTTEKLMLQAGGNDPNLPGKKIGDDREALDEEAMRSALTLRAAKRHEQEALAIAALKAPPRGVRLPPGWDVTTHRNRLEGMALGLQEKEIKQKNKVERARLAQIAKAKMEAAEREAAAKGRTIATAAGGAGAEAAMQAGLTLLRCVTSLMQVERHVNECVEMVEVVVCAPLNASAGLGPAIIFGVAQTLTSRPVTSSAPELV